MKKLLDVFLEHPVPTVNLDDLSELKDIGEHKFVHHMEILIDKGLICSVWPDSSLNFSRRHDKYKYPNSPIRLTADGHDFASELERPDTLKVITGRFKKEGLSVVIDVAKKLAKSRIEKELEKLV
ncbi:hypothetical protein [Photobacterium sanguinicancri]|uniref:hypothetical protein n=1 Tax=Photobacterium sanguinicancri TaxID=875932 RepID=UPI0021C40373|nr:hypothetical protein [Photobacterium sanguinicancri]